jgi:hypothetical protein
MTCGTGRQEGYGPVIELEGEYAMDTMFTIPHNILLVIGGGIVLAVVGFVVNGFVKGWKNVMPDYDKQPKEITIDG